jgi:hypothetical protein
MDRSATDYRQALLNMFDSALNRAILTSRGHSVLCSGSLNHINPLVHRASSIAVSSRDLSPSNNELQQAALVAVPVEVS